MIGEWKGGEFDTGHKANGFMKRLNWFGKTFVSAADAKPLVCLDAEGARYSNTEAMNGEASLWMEEFRGETVARWSTTASRCTTTSRSSTTTR